MSPVLALTSELPEVEFATGDVVIAEGTRTGGIWILLSGSLRVRRGDEPISVVAKPGAIIGEISLLLGQDHGATVEAAEPTRMRFAADGAGLFDTDGRFATLVATDLAGRLDSLTIYLADIKQQYRDSPGLAMVSDVLQHITRTAPSGERPVSARDPDPEY